MLSKTDWLESQIAGATVRRDLRDGAVGLTRVELENLRLEMAELDDSIAQFGDEELAEEYGKFLEFERGYLQEEIDLAEKKLAKDLDDRNEAQQRLDKLTAELRWENK